MSGLMLMNLFTASAAAGSDVKILMTNAVISGSSSNGNPGLLPGSIIEFQARAVYGGREALGQDSLAITNAVPSALSLIVADKRGDSLSPFAFVEGAPPSCLSCSFRSLDDNGDCVEFSNDGGASFNYRPAPDQQGADPAITHLRFRLRGTMAPASTEPSYFILKYRMKVD
jgi:hypothetical protein